MSSSHNRPVEFPIRLSFTCDEATAEALEQAAAQEDRSVSWIVRTAVREWLERRDQEDS